MEEAHRRFWQQIILYLANNEAGDGRLWVDVKQRTVFVGQRVDLTAGARNEAGTELEEFELNAQIIRRDENFKVLSRKELKFNRQGARGALSFETSEPGDYTVVVSGVIDGKKVTAEDRFLVVEAKQQEMLDTVPDVDAMRKLAETTGGMSISPGRFDDLMELLKKIPQNLNEEVITTSSLWDPMRRGPFASLGMPISLAAIFGFAMGGVVPLQGAVSGMAFGRQSFGQVMGLMRPAQVLLHAVGIPLMAWIHDTTGTFELAFQIALGVYGLAAILITGLRVSHPSVRANEAGLA